MAGVLNFGQLPLFRPPCHRRETHSRVPVIVPSSEQSEATSSSIGASPTEEKTVRVLSSAPPPPPPPNHEKKPKLLNVRRDKIFDILGASMALIFRFGTGVFVSGHSASWVPQTEIPPGQYVLDVEVAGYKLKETSKVGPRPEKPIEVYEFESCPFCRKVREIVAILDLDVLFYPCPKNGPNFRHKVAQMGGKQQFPYMVDPNTGVAMYESDGIIKYLVEKYGDGRVPFMLSLGLLTNATAGLAMIARINRGTFYTPSKLPPEPLEIWAYEGSPFCKIVREVLVELELPHILRSCARGSPKKQILFERAGHFLVPYLEDPNTGVQMFESADIVDYLRATYAVQ